MGLAQGALSDSTQRAYTAALNKFKLFCQSCNLCHLPANVNSLCAYISFLNSKGISPGSILSSISAISYWHKLNSLKDPSKEFVVQQILVSIRKCGGEGDKRQPITKEILIQLISVLKVLGLSGYEISMFKAIFIIAFQFALRLSEFTSSPHTLMFKNIVISDVTMIITFSSFKHSSDNDLLSHEFKADFSNTCPVNALNDYIAWRGLSDGPLFRLKGKAVSKTYFSKVLRQAVSYIGLPPSAFTSHSFRIGASTRWADEGLAVDVIRRRGRWKNEATVSKYIRGCILHN